MAATTAQAWTSARTLDALKRHFRLSDRELGERAGGYSRQQVEQRRVGKTAIDTDDLENFSRVFGCPPHVMLLEAGEAIRWILDNPRTAADQESAHTIWYTDGPRRRHLALVPA